ncbi:tRNA pseudouridine(38-40) synthase TruA [Veillonella agrestimuris]|uniref:tRNA pseudouridine(38-40) synthase TruA n=1 Tax=Veillonella agrestimuris TaxID=2941340 RepID=UPI00203E61A7|nr:tRNA pseudouridine(38-40) synthase TruA [Veillonella agrestimuris]
MRNIRIIVAYDGTHLAGYQKQPADKGITVQGALEEGLSKICNEPIQVYGASRTDAGVHARFQVCAFQTSGNIPVENIPRAMIAHLPKDIVVVEAIEIPLDWKPRHNIFGKAYSYTIYNRLIADPLTHRYHWHVKKPLHIEAMQEGARYLEGTHDFTTLKGANTTPVDPVKTIYAVGITEHHGHIRIDVVGDGFLYHMVRNIAGLLVDIGLGRIDPRAVPQLLLAKDRRRIGKTAPPQGLVLEEIFFTDSSMEAAVQRIKE